MSVEKTTVSVNKTLEYNYLKYNLSKALEKIVLLADNLTGLDKAFLIKNVRKKIDKISKELEEEKSFSLMYRMAVDLLDQKSLKVVEMGKYLQNDKIPVSLKEKLEIIRNEFSEKITSYYGILSSIGNPDSDMKDIKKTVYGVLSLDAGENIDSFMRIIGLKDNDLFKDVKQFAEENKNLAKIDEYTKMLKELSIEKEYARIKKTDRNKKRQNFVDM
jgi:hypothetical protein